MLRTMLIYGVITGAIIIGTMIIGFTLSGGEGAGSSSTVGYVIMLVAMSLIFVGIKRFRDNEKGGVIRFWPAFGLGAGIAAVAGVIYVIVWDIHLHMTDFAFVEVYLNGLREAKIADGLSGEELEAALKPTMDMMAQYRNPLIRIPITFIEIFPIGLIVALISAAILRNPRALPARAND